MPYPLLRLLLVSLFVIVPCSGQQWDRFRGPNGSGVVGVDGLPSEFGPAKSLVWKAAVPFGRSSPVEAGRHIVLTGSRDGRLVTLALDRSSGEVAWERGVEPVRDPVMFHQNDSATPSPASDGRNVYVFFPNAGLAALDSEGAVVWRRDTGDYENFYGLAASPVLAGDRLIVVCDQVAGSFIAAYDRRTGRQLWRQQRAGRFESHTTPLLYPAEGEPREVVVYGSGWADGYSLETGEKLWETSEVGVGPVGSPVLAGSILVAAAPNHGETPLPVWLNFAAGLDDDGDGRVSRAEMADHAFKEHFGWFDRDGDGYIALPEYEELLAEVARPTWGMTALDLGEQGTRRTPTVVWRYRQNLSYIPTPIVHQGVVYMVKEGGILSAIDLGSGELLKRGRIHNSAGEIYASPVIADGKLFVATRDGKVITIRPGPDWEVVSVNDLGEDIEATPAIIDGRLVVRTREAVYSFGRSY